MDYFLGDLCFRNRKVKNSIWLTVLETKFKQNKLNFVQYRTYHLEHHIIIEYDIFPFTCNIFASVKSLLSYRIISSHYTISMFDEHTFHWTRKLWKLNSYEPQLHVKIKKNWIQNSKFLFFNFSFSLWFFCYAICV